MSKAYDKYYQTENLFGQAYPELIAFYQNIKNKGKLLDVGCGQGRDAIPLARMGFDVTGIDNSKVGIKQLNEVVTEENLSLQGMVVDIYEYKNFDQYDFILLDSMFHFNKNDRPRELRFLNTLISQAKAKAIITICIQKNKRKIETLNTALAKHKGIEILNRTSLIYKFEDKAANHSVDTPYVMLSILKH